jgi:hypothetical protein
MPPEILSHVRMSDLPMACRTLVVLFLPNRWMTSVAVIAVGGSSNSMELSAMATLIVESVSAVDAVPEGG